jgi:hypothetical protein
VPRRSRRGGLSVRRLGRLATLPASSAPPAEPEPERERELV